MKKQDPSQDYIKFICDLYGDAYDDREEDSAPGGEDWQPGVKANHQSLKSFQKDLADVHDIHLSTAKIRKILISGGCWTTERSREVAELYEKYGSVRDVAEELEVSDALVTMYLPYEKVVYDLEDKSGNAQRIVKYRKRQKDTGEWRIELWRWIIDHAGEVFVTSGRGSRAGVEFTYSVSAPGKGGGRHYSGESVEGFGNEMWITKAEGAKKKSISRSTVELTYQKYQELMESGKLKGPKSLGIPGAGSYLYPLMGRIVEESGDHPISTRISTQEN